MARHGVAVTAARASVIAQLNAAPAEGAFPAASLALVCPIAAQLQDHPALATEDWLRGALRTGRAVDAAAGSARIGAHRADLAISDATTGLPAAQASTGQQKSLLLGIVLGHAQLLGRTRGFAPLLLLDEPLVHLDETRRGALFDTLARLPAQCFLTGTDAALFAPLAEVADGFTVSAGVVAPWLLSAGSAINPG